MSKYIDADKLIAEIENLEPFSCISKEQDGFYGAVSRINNIIDSLQQEQPDVYNQAMLEVKAYVDKLYDKASIGLNEYDMGLYNGIIETCMKLRGFIKARTSKEQPEPVKGKFVFPKLLYARTLDNKTIDVSYAPQDMTAIEYVRNDAIEQEQPEVDLEEKIQDWCKENVTGVKPIYTADSLIYDLLPKTARHFYELGKARKEIEL